MKSVEPYKDLNHTLKMLRRQVKDGLPYALRECPKFKDPEALFYWLKERIKYKLDPKGNELIRSLPTLMKGYKGKPGEGDCDCFTTAALTLLVASGFRHLYVILVGRNPFTPVHIYCGLIDKDGVFRILDLTNRLYDYERPNYSHQQHLEFPPFKKKRK